jgi:hypothetical protein
VDVEPEVTLRGLAQIIERGNGGRHGDCFDEGAALLGARVIIDPTSWSGTPT